MAVNGHRRTPALGPPRAAWTAAASPRPSAPDGPRVEEIESVAQLGWYGLDIATGVWRSSAGLDAVFGIDAAFVRSVDGWASLIHPDDRPGMLAYLANEVLGRRQPFDRVYRIVRADTGETRWVHGRGRLELDRQGSPTRMLGTIADITEQQRTHDALARSELRYAAIFEGTIEAILIAEQETLRIRWVNAAATTLLGYPREELVRLTVHDLHPPAALPAVLGQFAARRVGPGVERSVPCLCKDGSVILADVRGSPVEIDGLPCVVGFFSDVTELTRLEARDRKLALALEQAGEAFLIAGPGGELEYANPAFERLSGLGLEGVLGHTISISAGSEAERKFTEMWAAVSGGATWRGDFVHPHPDGDDRVAEVSVSPVREPDGAIAGYVAVERDVTNERALQAAHERLAAAVEQTSDSVIISDLTGAIEYVNPAFERSSGYTRNEAIGQNPRILKSGRQSAAFYRAMWRRLTRGQIWTGTLINRRKDGELYEEEATISPIRGPGGEVSGYVAVKREVTAVRAAESALAAEFRERAQVAAALGRLQPSSTAQATAADVCAEMLALPGIDAAGILDFVQPGQAVPLAVGGIVGPHIHSGEPLPDERAAYLYQRALQGPWAEAWSSRDEDGAYGAMMTDLGIKASAYAPVRNGQGLLGLVVVSTRDESYARHLVDHLPVVGEFAATAGALLSASLELGHSSDVERMRLGRVLADHAFSPVFQPIFALGTAEVVGYEALTRFADGTPPDRVIAEAHVAGLGQALELATMTAALAASDALPAGCWLSLNVSPDVILKATELRGLVAGRSRRIVLEVTEHAQIQDYLAIRAAVARLGPTVSLAVDDAGSGFASLRHVVELKPQFLKLDISLVRNVDRDLTRQAMVAGLAQFAERARCEVIAEGIEEQAELDMLRGLGVRLGQGYLLGRPGPIGGS